MRKLLIVLTVFAFCILPVKVMAQADAQIAVTIEVLQDLHLASTVDLIELTLPQYDSGSSFMSQAFGLTISGASAAANLTLKVTKYAPGSSPEWQDAPVTVALDDSSPGWLTGILLDSSHNDPVATAITFGRLIDAYTFIADDIPTTANYKLSMPRQYWAVLPVGVYAGGLDLLCVIN